MSRFHLLHVSPVLGLGALILTSCGRGPSVEARDSSPADIPSVAVTRVKTENLARNLVLTAEFKPYQEIEVMAKVSGYVKQIGVDIGDRVHTGQILATLEVPEMQDDVKRAKANVQQSQAQVQRAQDELRRAK